MNNSTIIKNFCVVTENGKGKAWDITQSLQYCFINESLFNFHLLGFATIIDTNNWIEKLPINSNCWLNIKIYSNINNSEMELTFHITGISDIQRLQGNKKQYNIQFVSEEAIQNFNVRISKGYAGPSTSIVRDILSKITQKSILISKVNDDSKILSPNMHPYKLIDTLNLYGSKNYYDFILWENFRGLNYHRVTELLNRKVIHNIAEKDISAITEKEIHNNPDYLSDTNNITNYYQPENEDLIQQLKTGVLGSSTYTYNSLNGMPYKYEVDSSKRNNIVYHFNEDTLNYKNYGSRHKILNQMIDNELLVVTFGDFERCTGDMCHVEINGAAKQAEYTSSLSGDFLIIRIEHEFTPVSYKQTLGLTR